MNRSTSPYASESSHSSHGDGDGDGDAEKMEVVDTEIPPSRPEKERSKEELEIEALTGRIRELDEELGRNSGSMWEGWWYALLDIPGEQIAAAEACFNAEASNIGTGAGTGEGGKREWKGNNGGITLAMLEEDATSGRFFERVPLERILAERKRDGWWGFEVLAQDEFLVMRQGFSELRAEWRCGLWCEELRRGHEVREQWERGREVENGEVKGFDVEMWEERKRRDERLRWERRGVALERRRVADAVGFGRRDVVEGRALEVCEDEDEEEEEEGEEAGRKRGVDDE